MSDNTIQQWLAQARAAGFSDVQITAQLKQQGWGDDQIQKLVGGATSPSVATVTDRNQVVPSDTIPDVLALFKQAWEIYKSRIGAFVVIGLIFLFIEGLLYFVSFLLVGGTAVLGIASSATVFKGNTTAQIATSVLAISFASVAVTVIFGFFLAWVWSALIHTIHTYKEKIDLGTIMSRAFKTMIPLWWVSMLLSFFVSGASFLLFIPGIIFAVWFSNALFLPVTEGTRGMQSLLRSKEYVRGAWWGVLGRQLAFGLLVGAAFFGLFLVLGLGTIFLRNTAGAIGAMASIAVTFVYLAITALVMPFGLCYSYALYSGLRAYKARAAIDTQQTKKAGLIITAIAGWLVIPLIGIGIVAFVTSMTNSFLPASTGSNNLFNSNSSYNFNTNSLNNTNNSTTSAGNNDQRKADLNTISAALVKYFNQHSAYPTALTDIATLLPNSKVPADPSDNTSYYYYMNSDGTFDLCALLDDPTTYVKEYCIKGAADGTIAIQQ